MKIPSAENAALFLWTTAPMMKKALIVMDAWKFQYKTIAFTWVKTNPISSGFFMGEGFYTRSNPEFLLLGIRGHMKRVKNNIRQLFIAPRQKHSKKPTGIKTLIVQLFGDLPRIELFARGWTEGWDAFGNEVENLQRRL